MATNHPKAGPNSVPAYQLSGIPYVTGSGLGTQDLSSETRQINFPYVTRFITFSNNLRPWITVAWSLFTALPILASDLPE